MIDFKVDVKSPLQDSLCTCWSINHPHCLASAIRNCESNVEFLDEGLIVTYPLSKLTAGYSKAYKKFADASLQDLRVTDVVPNSSDATKLSDFCFNDVKNPGLVVFLFPIFSDQQTKFKEFILPELVDTLYVYGYNLSQFAEFTAAKELITCEKRVKVMSVQFEAKFSDLDVKLSNSLFHVSPSRYFEKICKNGLVPYTKSAKMKYPERVYLFNCPEDTLLKVYGKGKIHQLKPNSYTANDKFCVFKIKRSKLEAFSQFKDKKLVFYYDPCYVYPKACITESKAVFTYGNIPRQLLEDECLVYEV